MSADRTNEETCNLLDGSLIRRWIFLTVWPLVKGRHSLLAFATFAFAPVLAGTWELAGSQLPSFGSLPSCDHTRHTRNSCLQTSLTCPPCLSNLPHFLPLLVLHPRASISGEPLAALARVSPRLQPRFNSQLATARATSPATECFSMSCEDHTCDSVVSMHRAPLQSWCCAQLQKPSVHSSMRETRSP